jgi:RNA polymerase sigma factor (sigma-70 family)
VTSPSSNGKPHSEDTARPPAAWIAEVWGELEVPLVDYVRRRVGRLEVARDIVQEAFVQLCQQAWPGIQRHATAWLYRTCRHRAIDHLRKEGRMNRLNSTAEVSQLADCRGAPPQRSAEEAEQREQLQRNLQQLSEQQQEILRLRLHAGLSYRQIADVTGLTVSNIGYHLHHALKQLRRCMSDT